MLRATHYDSTLCLNASNHPSCEGLMLTGNVPTPVTAEQATYLRSIGVEVVEDAEPPTYHPEED